MIDYLHWRGDLPLCLDPFCEVDNIVLSQLSYVDFSDIVPGLSSKATITVEEANRAFFARHTEDEVENGKSLIHLAPFVLKAMAAGDRFRHAELCYYVNTIDNEKDEQFSAIHIRLSDGTIYVAFRGTDDTLVGWKEDCALALGTIPAQVDAVAYLEKTTRGAKRKYRIGGHSKGGNLVVYAATHCEAKVQNRIISIYNNDGPGFSEEQLQAPGFDIMLPRMQMFVPEESLIGMLFHHRQPHRCVQSSQTGVMQHDAMSWQIIGNHFLTKDDLSENTKLINSVLSRWIDELTIQERTDCIDTIFGVLEASGATTLEGIVNQGIKSLPPMLSKLNSLHDKTAPLLSRLIQYFAEAYSREYLPDFIKQILHRATDD
ncbi:MAG: Mbeg1-like protein [Clostridia bacterium]